MMDELMDKLAELEAQNESLRASNRGICALADERVAQMHKLRLEVARLKRENGLLRSGILPDDEYLSGVALGMNIRFIGERVGEAMDGVPVC